MVIMKSEVYSSPWSSCDELRGGMDVNQYEDYVLVMLLESKLSFSVYRYNFCAGF